MNDRPAAVLTDTRRMALKLVDTVFTEHRELILRDDDQDPIEEEDVRQALIIRAMEFADLYDSQFHSARSLRQECIDALSLAMIELCAPPAAEIGSMRSANDLYQSFSKTVDGLRNLPLAIAA